jgi:hypothetical protein
LLYSTTLRVRMVAWVIRRWRHVHGSGYTVELLNRNPSSSDSAQTPGGLTGGASWR